MLSATGGKRPHSIFRELAMTSILKTSAATAAMLALAGQAVA